MTSGILGNESNFLENELTSHQDSAPLMHYDIRVQQFLDEYFRGS